MRENKKLRLGSYSNNLLEQGMLNLEWSNEDLINAETYILRMEERIEKLFDKEIFRVENILKDKLRIIPKNKDFAIWYFDNLPIRRQKKTIEITDEDIIKYARIYLQKFQKLLDDNSKKQTNHLKSFNWISDRFNLEKLYSQLLKKEFISSNTSLDIFINIFANRDLNSIENKIIWMKIGRNKMTNKKSISDFINILEEYKLIEGIKENIPKILTNCFKSENSNLNFTHSNLSNSNVYSEYRIELEKIIKDL
ncbi:hypothetical protein HHL23_12415 [Chryseobacterium sp. RP-3-3]|uniref:Uncharacterized protein n=1 Tax=Chryseobacterium antibioticum TaxID=2728847 RepID=A0A7Y0FRW5_9FLAO|nr:hypothetical protein [Chryseobacterium antibioticum]NML70603.1 hypothetical protein [Chryseobacterium antibioticum]